MRVKLIRTYGIHQPGQVLVLNDKLAYKLVRDGVGEITKDMTQSDYKARADNGNTRRLRTNNRRRR